MATMYTVLGGTLLNLGITMSNQGNAAMGNGSFIAAGDCVMKLIVESCSNFFIWLIGAAFECAGIFMTLFVRSMQRVKMLDKFEEMI